MKKQLLSAYVLSRHKMIFLFPLLFVFCGSSAQTDLQVEITRPAQNEVIVNGVPFTIDITVTNNGSIAIEQSDILTIDISINGISISNTQPAHTANWPNGIGFSFFFNNYSLPINADGPIQICAQAQLSGKTDITPNDNKDCNTAIGTVFPTSVESFESRAVHIYPNPVNNDASIIFTRELQGELIIYSITGRILIGKSFKGSKINVSTDNLPNGLYSYSIISEDHKLLHHGKISILH